MNEDFNTLYDAYIKERQHIDRAALELGKHYDTWLLTLAGGALLLSITFVEKLVNHPHFLVLLGVAWACLVITIGVQLWALGRSSTAVNQKVFLLEYEYSKALYDRGIMQGDLGEPPRSPEEYSRAIRTANSIAFGSFILAIFLLAVFSGINLNSIDNTNLARQAPKEELMDNKKPLNESRGTYTPSPVAKLPPSPQPSQNQPSPQSNPPSSTPTPPPSNQSPQK